MRGRLSRSRSPRSRRSRRPRISPQSSGLSELIRNITQLAVETATGMPQTSREADEGSASSTATGDASRGSCGSFDTNAITRLLIGHLIQYLIRRRFRSRRRTGRGRLQSSDIRPAQQHSATADHHGIEYRSPAEGTFTLLRSDVNEVVDSLDRLLHQLQSTEDLVQRTMYTPATHENCDFHRDVIVNAGSLQVSIANSATEARRVRAILEQQAP